MSAVVDLLVAKARPLILADFRADSCLASTRVAFDVLRAAGVRVKPMVTESVALNAQVCAAIDADRSLDEDDVAAGARLVQTDLTLARHDTKRFPGHLVAVLPDDRLLVDLSADQVDRPAKGIYVPGPVVIPLTATWERGDHYAGLDLAFGGRLLYRRVRNPALDYRAAKDWAERDRTAHIVAALVAELRQAD